MTKKNAPTIIVIIALAAALFGLVMNNIPILGSFRFIWGPGTALLLLMIKPTIIFTPWLKNLLIYGLIVIFLLPNLIWHQMDEWNRRSLLEEFISLLFVFIVIAFYLKKKDPIGLSLVAKYSLVFMLISVFITHLVLFVDPTIIRDSAAVFDENETRLNLAERTGAIGYGYAQGITFLFPVFIFAIKYKLKLIWSVGFTLIIFLLFLFLTIRSQVFSNLLVGSIIIILSLIGTKNKSFTYTLIGVIVFLIFVIPVEVYSNLLREASTFFDARSETYLKLNDFANFIVDPETDNEDLAASHRASRYPMLLSSLAENPLLGTLASYKTSYQEEGAHLYFMNRLAIWGIPVFLFFLYVLFSPILRIRNFLDNRFKYYYFLSVLAFIMYGLTKNIAGREPFIILFIIVPGTYYLLRRNNPAFFKKLMKN
ncbi:MAG: hypothetical protein R3277_08065 [Brumimicrobium sp.]|nr:hypothetical protein [Brumimicrobium sp.]